MLTDVGAAGAGAGAGGAPPNGTLFGGVKLVNPALIDVGAVPVAGAVAGAGGAAPNGNLSGGVKLVNPALIAVGGIDMGPVLPVLGADSSGCFWSLQC